MPPLPEGPVADVWSYIADASTAGKVIVPIAAIVDGTGLAPLDVEAALLELGTLGLIASWTADADPVATLTPLAADRLGLVLVRHAAGRMSGMVWAKSRAGEC